jgi:tetratricopeptide (TPR) repeat protein
MTGSTDWLSAIGILLSGIVLGVMFIYAYVRRRQNTAAVGDGDLEFRELQAKRDALIQQLRELEDSGDATPEERKRLEMKTAEVLRAIDGGKFSKTSKAAVAGSKPANEAVVAAPAGYFGRNPAVKGFLYGVASFAALAFLGFYVYHSAQQREGAQGVTGSTSMQPQGMAAQAPQQQPDPAVLQLEAAVKAAPEDLGKRIELARAYLDRDNMMGVFEQTKYVLEKNPNDPRALTYNAIVRMSMGQLPDAKKMLEAATKTDPTITDAWVALAWMGIQEGRAKDAEVAIGAAIKAHPEQEARLREVFSEMRQAQQKKAAPLPPGAVGQPLPPGHPAIDANGAPATAMAMAAAAAPSPMATPGSAAPAADAVHITLNIDPAANPKSGIVYVLARPAGQAAGPPIAVKRLSIASFPAKVEFSSSDSMMGDPLPAKMHIEARLAPTGDVTTKKPSDPHAAIDGVATKSMLTLTLK